MKAISLFFYNMIRFFVVLIYPKIEVVGEENIPKEPSLIVGNHSQMNGPIAGELYFPGNHYIWCAAEMMHFKEVPAYAYKDFWSRKPWYTKWLFKIASYLIAPLSVCVFNNAHTVGVYHDKRVLTTFRETNERLKEGNHVIIFPEHDVPYNHILCDFQEGFVDMARSYYKQTGKKLNFVPMYLAPRLKKMYIGKPIEYNPDINMKEQRVIICNYLKEAITEIAVNLPLHTVIPYNNVPVETYGTNKPKED